MKTWTDPKTGLEWQVEPATTRMTWQEAKEYAASLGEGWRLPTREELLGISGLSRPSELRGAGWFWSSSPVGDGDALAWGVSFLGGSVGSGGVGYDEHVRCVR